MCVCVLRTHELCCSINWYIEHAVHVVSIFYTCTVGKSQQRRRWSLHFNSSRAHGLLKRLPDVLFPGAKKHAHKSSIKVHTLCVTGALLETPLIRDGMP